MVLGPAEAPDTEDDLAYATPRSGSFEPDREGRWRVIEDDIPRWSMLDGLSETFDPFITASGLRGAISGIVWTHTPGPSGSAFMYSTAARRRRSHYWSGEMPLPYRSIPFLPRFTLLGPIVRRGDWHGTIAFVVRTPAFRQHAAGPMMIQGRFGVPRTADVALFDHPGTWVAASEPSDILPEDGLRNVSLDADGTVVTVIAERGGTLFDPDAQQCPKGQCPGSRILLAGPRGVDTARGGHVAALDTSIAGAFVLSATRGQIWRVAGGATGGSLATYDSRAERWQVRPVRELGEVLAAVYSPREDVLWVLDQQSARARGRSGHSALTARLLALRPNGGRVTVVASWRRLTNHDRFAMALDPAGRLYIAAGRHVLHALALVDPSLAGVELLGVRVGLGAVVPGMIRANAAGVAFATEHGDRQAVATYESRDFNSRAGDMSSCL